MPYKVKEHYRKTKKGLVRVKESDRKDKLKKALVVGVGALTTLGLGALAYKRLGSKLAKGAVTISTKADNVAANKAKDITNLVTPKKSNLLTGAKYKAEKIADPWLDDAVTVTKSKTALVTGKKETKLLTASKYESPDYIPSTKPTKGFRDAKGNARTLGKEVNSQRTLIRREPTDIANANKKLELGENYIKRDSPAYNRTGKSYIKRAKERLTIISNRSPDRTSAKLITIRGKTKKLKTKLPDPWLDNSVVEPIEIKSILAKDKPQLLLSPAKAKSTAIEAIDRPKSNSRRELLKRLTGVRTVRQLQTKNPGQIIMEAGKNTVDIEKAGQETADKITNVLSTSANRRTAIKAGAKGAENVVKSRVKRKIKGKLIGRLTQSLRKKEFSLRNQSSAINRYRKLATQLSNENIPNKTRRQLLQAIEDFTIPGGSAAKKKKALEIYNNVFQELIDLNKDTGLSIAENTIKKKIKNKGLRKSALWLTKMKKILGGEV